MRDFTSLSGPWTGMSVQRSRRISEAIRLSITSTRIVGEGTDSDGRFSLLGSYDPETQRVSLTRRYSLTTEPSQQSVGIPFDYLGTWDGMMVSGFWCVRADPLERGPFEMWPSREEDMEGLRIEAQEEETLALPGGGR